MSVTIFGLLFPEASELKHSCPEKLLGISKQSFRYMENFYSEEEKIIIKKEKRITYIFRYIL